YSQAPALRQGESWQNDHYLATPGRLYCPHLASTRVQPCATERAAGRKNPPPGANEKVEELSGKVGARTTRLGTEWTSRPEVSMIAQTDKAKSYRPSLIVAHCNADYTALLSRSLAGLGWEVHLAATGADVRRLAWEVGPAVVILDTELDGESGWLTCNK